TVLLHSIPIQHANFLLADSCPQTVELIQVEGICQQAANIQANSTKGGANAKEVDYFISSALVTGMPQFKVDRRHGVRKNAIRICVRILDIVAIGGFEIRNPCIFTE